ncbi:MAG: LysR family transcriptional regulator [Pseudomonadota bacterium]
MDLQDMRIFVRVASVQNLSAVGLEMALTPGTISKRIQALESELGVRLFDRTTRSIRITEEGRTFLSHVERILDEVETARAAVSEAVTKPKGRIRVSAPSSFGRAIMAPAMCDFMNAYSDVEVQMDLTDTYVNLHEDGYDLAIRTGELPDSTLIAKRLASDRRVVVASPLYLQRHGVPHHPADLASHQCLLLADKKQWAFTIDGAVTGVRVNGQLRSDNGSLLRYAAIHGQGIVNTSELTVLQELKSGDLVELFQDFAAPSETAIWGVYPSAKHMLPKLRVFLDFLTDWLRGMRGAPSEAWGSACDAVMQAPARATSSGEPLIAATRQRP